MRRGLAVMVVVVVVAAVLWIGERETDSRKPSQSPDAPDAAGGMVGPAADAALQTRALDQPLAGFAPRAAVEVGEGASFSLQLDGSSVPGRWFRARDASAPLVIWAPDRGGAADEVRDFAAALGEVMDAHVVTWDAPDLHGLAAPLEHLRRGIVAARALTKGSSVLALVGVGRGATEALLVAGEQDVAAVVACSPIAAVAGRAVTEGIGELRGVPVLAIAARGDADAASAMDALDRVGGARVRRVAGGLHGASLVADRRVRSDVLGFLFAVLSRQSLRERDTQK